MEIMKIKIKKIATTLENAIFLIAGNGGFAQLNKKSNNPALPLQGYCNNLISLGGNRTFANLITYRYCT